MPHFVKGLRNINEEDGAILFSWKAFRITCVNLWVFSTVICSFLNPNWWSGIHQLSFNNGDNLDKRIFLKSLDIVGSRHISFCFGSIFTRTTFQLLGKYFKRKMALKVKSIHFNAMEGNSISILLLISSIPENFFGLNLPINFSIFLSSQLVSGRISTWNKYGY